MRLSVITRFFFVCLLFSLCADQGIIVSCSDKYTFTCLINLAYLRDYLGCTLPIEVWYAGDELSERSKDLLKGCGVEFKDLCQIYSEAPKKLRGFHSKPLALAATGFDEVLLMDADLFFFCDPSFIFSHPRYLETGAYFFRDRLEVKYCAYGKQPKYSAFGDWSPNYQYRHREALFRELIETPSQYVPIDWRHYWTKERPSFSNPFPSEHQESSCMAVDKKKHKQGIENLLLLNTIRRKEIYSVVYGDKETYWLSFEMAKEPYFINEQPPLRLYGEWVDKDEERPSVEMVHFVDGKMFYANKPPIDWGRDPLFVNSSIPVYPDFDHLLDKDKRGPTFEESIELNNLLFYYELLAAE